MRLDGKTTTELTDSSGFEFNTMRPRSQYARSQYDLEYNTSWSQSVINRTRVLTEEIRYVLNSMKVMNFITRPLGCFLSAEIHDFLIEANFHKFQIIS